MKKEFDTIDDFIEYYKHVVFPIKERYKWVEYLLNEAYSFGRRDGRMCITEEIVHSLKGYDGVLDSVLREVGYDV